jgi:hypothetical protein
VTGRVFAEIGGLARMKLHVFASPEDRVHDKEVKSCRGGEISACERQGAADSVPPMPMVSQ